MHARRSVIASIESIEMENHSTSRVASHSTEESSGTSIDLSSSSTSTSFDILFEYEGSKQPLSVKHEDVVTKIENQLGKLGTGCQHVHFRIFNCRFKCTMHAVACTVAISLS